MIKYIVEVPVHMPENGFKLSWEDNFIIIAENDENSVKIIANEAGLRSLANHLLNLAQPSVSNGTHIHLDEFNSLESNSIDIIIEKQSN